MTPVLLAGIAVGLILLAMPTGLVETIVASSGLSEALPAAAPPLGLKARLLLAGFGALMAMGCVCFGAASRTRKDRRPRSVTGVSDMGFALPKLNWLSRGRATGASRISRPLARRADAHPDAPARTPIFASRDFGGLEIFPRIAPARGEQLGVDHGEEQVILPGVSTLEQAECVHAPIDVEFEDVTAHPSVEATREEAPAVPSLAELTARFEKGLADRVRGSRTAVEGGVIADMPIEQRVPVRDHVEDDVDQALRAALGTLRAMADRTR
ncbi:MAG TPA: hypothetical protein VN110_01845 [Sphingobium sp.]|nr:hypothetical protein [Sphingobium sp.]